MLHVLRLKKLSTQMNRLPVEEFPKKVAEMGTTAAATQYELVYIHKGSSSVLGGADQQSESNSRLVRTVSDCRRFSGKIKETTTNPCKECYEPLPY